MSSVPPSLNLSSSDVWMSLTFLNLQHFSNLKYYFQCESSTSIVTTRLRRAVMVPSSSIQIPVIGWLDVASSEALSSSSSSKSSSSSSLLPSVVYHAFMNSSWLADKSTSILWPSGNSSIMSFKRSWIYYGANPTPFLRLVVSSSSSIFSNFSTFSKSSFLLILLSKNIS